MDFFQSIPKSSLINKINVFNVKVTVFSTQMYNVSVAFLRAIKSFIFVGCKNM